MKVFTVAEMVAAEKAADGAGVSYATMMETAGRGVAQAILERVPIDGMRVTVLVGPGNNGGDGLVAGRYLAEAGADVAFYLFKPRDPATDENFALIQQMQLFVVEAGFDQQFRVLHTRLQNSDLIIDALLGTGVSRPVGGKLAKLLTQVEIGIEQRNKIIEDNGRFPLTSITHPCLKRASQPEPGLIIVSVDCPSGLNCNTGALDKLAIPADLTVTFAGPKRGHFIFPGAAACGEIVVVDINIPPELPEIEGVAVEVATAVTAQKRLPPRPLDGHKGTFGTALIVAGSAQYWGAPVLAARAAYKAGAGLVALAVPGTIRATAATQLPEATFPIIHAQEMFDAGSVAQVLETAVSAKALLVGPGLGLATEFIMALTDAKDQLPPLVVDADGLNVLATIPDWPQRLPPNSILTPHPGEMARLMGVSLAEVKQLDRVDLAQRMAAAWGHVVLLKGAYTVVAGGNGRAEPGRSSRCTILPFANPVLGVAGSGDVLAGVIVSLLAQGLAPFDAAVLGGYLHGLAGQLASETTGNAGVLAGEFAKWIGKARNNLTQTTPSL